MKKELESWEKVKGGRRRRREEREGGSLVWALALALSLCGLGLDSLSF